VVLLWKFLCSIVGNEQDIPDFYDGLKSAEIMDAVIISDKEKKWMKLNTSEKRNQ